MGDPLGIKAYLAMGKLVGLLILIGVCCYQSSQIHKWHKQADAQAEARRSDQTAYRVAQVKAKADNQAQVQKVEAQHEVVTNRIRSDFSRDLERLRAQARTHPGAAGSAGASGVPQAASGTDADGLPNTPCDNLCASEIELRLMYLQNWIAGQAGIDPNK